MDLSDLKIGYVPYARDMNSPGDRRRFAFFARSRALSVELADPRKNYDLVYLSARADLSAWSSYEGSAKIVFELIDSYLALSENIPKNRLRGLAKFASGELSKPTLSYRSALIAMAKRADGMVCSTEEQREDLSDFCSNVHVILDVHEEIGSDSKRDYAAGRPFRLFWEGLAYTLGAFESIGPSLRRTAARHPLALHLATDLRSARYLGRFLPIHTQDRVRRIFPETYVYQWNPQLLGPIATSCDLGVIPLDLSDPFSRGKPENKLLLLWRLGIPTLTSASPAYGRAMAACGLDMTCDSTAEWENKLELYLQSEALRREAGEAGRRYTEMHHSRSTVLSRWDRLFESVLIT